MVRIGAGRRARPLVAVCSASILALLNTIWRGVWLHASGYLTGTRRHVPEDPVRDVHRPFSGSRIGIMENYGEAGRVLGWIAPLEGRRNKICIRARVLSW